LRAAQGNHPTQRREGGKIDARTLQRSWHRCASTRLTGWEARCGDKCGRRQRAAMAVRQRGGALRSSERHRASHLHRSHRQCGSSAFSRPSLRLLPSSSFAIPQNRDSRRARRAGGKRDGSGAVVARRRHHRCRRRARGVHRARSQLAEAAGLLFYVASPQPTDAARGGARHLGRPGSSAAAVWLLSTTVGLRAGFFCLFVCGGCCRATVGCLETPPLLPL